MEIRILSITLRNFKGARECTFRFDGGNARIEGRNGAGKSTVFDAFTWLLFGKDHRDQTTSTFELKTIDPETGRPYPREDHWVEAELTVDGELHVLRRAWMENWVKPTGEVEEVMKGHNTLYFIDGQDAGTMQAYNQYIARWMNEAVFKLITNPLYFIDEKYTGWQSRRKALLELVKDAPEREAVRREFADLVDRLSGRSIEDYRKRVQMEKRANKRDLEDARARIAGMKEALPEEVDTEAVRAKIDAITAGRDAEVARIRAKIAEIDAAIADAGKAMDAKKAETAKIWDEITALQLKMGNYIADRKRAAQEQNAARQQAILQASAEVSRLGLLLAPLRVREEELTRQEDEGKKERGRIAVELKALGERYQAEKARAFEYVPQTVCPTCGQELPAASVEEAREKAKAAYMDQRKRIMDGIIAEAKELKAKAAAIERRVVEVQGDRRRVADEVDLADTELSKWQAELKRRGAIPVVDTDGIEKKLRDSEEVRAMQREEYELRSQASKAAARPDGMEELTQRRQDLEKELDGVNGAYQEAVRPLNARLSVNDERRRQLELIERKEVEARNYADALANDERLEARIQDYIKADIDSVEAAINGLFRVARWKMFDRTIDGGLVETCEVCTGDGIPYRSMNDAAKTLCGMDVIRVFSERYGCRAPIFIDNAEGVLETGFGTTAQVIRLVVKDCDLTTVAE